jgi:LDH2 family malate/lactate/ureidoglycolate dehydrogenase
MSATADSVFTYEALSANAVAILRAAGVSDADAELVADALVSADARGMHSHGMTRLAIYTKRILAGGARAGVAGRIVSESAATLVLDGEGGIGQVITARAMREAIDRAREAGAGVVGVRGSNHFGEGAYYVADAVENGMIGLLTTNGSPNMPYHGGTKTVLGTLPLAIGIPAGDEPPIILDLAFGTVSKGKILQAAARGEKIPIGWAVDASGNDTDDPNAVLDGGWTLPIGAYKGSGLILVMEILSAVLTGAQVAGQVGDLYGDPAEPQGLGHFALAIDIARFMPVEHFNARMDELVRSIRASGPPGQILMPGEREHQLSTERRERGVPLPDATVADLRTLADSLGVPPIDASKGEL